MVTRSCLDFRLLGVLILISILSSHLSDSYYSDSHEPSINYTWLEYNDKYDAIVGISVEGTPICSGVLVNKYTVITAANPIHVNVNYYYGNSRRLYVHAIAGAFDHTVVHKVEKITFQSRRGSYFRPFGFDGRHSPIHDVVILCLQVPMQTFTVIIYLDRMAYWGDTTTTKIIRFPPHARRHYTMRPVIAVKTFEPHGWCSIAGHGFIDRPHVKQNVDLEVIDYEVEHVLQDCDEWIPRGWGHFICLLNIENFVGVGAGSALFYNRRFIGIGSFSVLKGNESILLFTDLRKYHGMKGFRGYVDIIQDSTDASFNPDDVTPRADWFYLPHLGLAEGKNETRSSPYPNYHRGGDFYS